MTPLIIATLGFVLIHLGISGTRLRDVLVARLGDGPYMGLYSLASFVFIAWMSVAYNDALASADNLHLWAAPIWFTHLGGVVMLLALSLIVIGVTTPGVTSVQVGPMAGSGLDPRGIHRITRHPFLWGVTLFALFHAVANGDVASLVFFGGFGVVSVLGTVSIDEKRARKMGSVWSGYAHATSNVPFAAIATGRNRLALGEIKAWQWGAALIAFLALFYSHLALFAVSPVPGWAPY